MSSSQVLTVKELAQKLETTESNLYQQISKGYLFHDRIDNLILNSQLKAKAKVYSIRELVLNHPSKRKLPERPIVPTQEEKEDDLSDMSYEELKMLKLQKETEKLEFQNKLQKISIDQKRGELIDRFLVTSTTNSYLNLLNQEILDIGPSLGDEIFGIAKKFDSPIEGRAAIVNFLNRKLSDIILNAKKKIGQIL